MSLLAHFQSSSKPLRSLYFFLVAFFVAAYCIAAARHWHDARQDAASSLHYLNSTLAHNIRTTLRNFERNLRGIGTELVLQNALDSPDRGRALVERIRAIDPGMAGFGLARIDGQLILISGVAENVPLPNLAEQDETRESFLRSLETRKLEIGRPYFMKLLGQWVIPVRVPLLDAQGIPVAVMTAGYPLEGEHSLLAQAVLPPHTSTAVIRDDGYLQYLHPLPTAPHASRLHDIFARPAVPGMVNRPIDQAHAPSSPHASWGNLPPLGGRHLIALERIPEYGLTAAAYIPLRTIVTQWLHRMLLPSLLLGFFLTASWLIYQRTLARQRVAEDAVARLADWQQAVLDAAEYSIISTDTAGRIVSFNAAAERMLGYRADEMVGHATPEVFHDADEVRAHADELSRAFGFPVEPGFEVFVARARHGGSEEREWTYLHKNGQRIPVRLTVSPLRGPTGDIEGFLGIAEDLTRRHAIEQALDESRQALIERNANLGLINQLSNRIHASLELDDILNESMNALAGLSRTPHVTLYLLSADGQQLELAASRAFDTERLMPIRTIPLDGSLCGMAVRDKRAQACEDLAHDARILPCLRENLAAAGLASGVAVPVIYNEQALGGINVMYATPHAISESELDTLNTFANTLAMALANARHAARIAHQAQHDSLTGLPNRSVLHDAFADKLSGGGMAALMLLDLDRFKEVNDTLGHHVGDLLLTQIGARLLQGLSAESALVCRLGGDEFAVLLPRIPNEADALESARTLNTMLRKPFLIQGIPFQIGASIGVAVYPGHGNTSHDLLRAADVAMYQAKRLGSGVVLYDRSFDTHSPERLAFAVELAHAIENGELILHYQPKLDLTTRRVVGFEALVRWQHPRLGLLYPGDFIDLAEMNESIHAFTRAVLDLALTDKRTLNLHGHAQPVAFNLSARNLLDDQFAAHLKTALAKHAITAREIEIELTETILMQDPATASSVLRKIAEQGIAIAVDDYGTGYSSLGYLRHLPLTALKIDRSFVLGMIDNAQDAIIVRSTIGLAHNLGLAVIAEGVENAQTADALREMGCDQAQGYYYSRPLPLPDLLAWLDRQLADVAH